MEQLNKILAEYIKRLGIDYETAIATGNATPELSFRPALDDFLVQMSGFIDRKIDRIFEPRQQGKYGRPDWLFSNKDTMGIYGYVEAKSFNPNVVLNPVDYERQVKRYLYLGNPVILTDGIDFIVYYPNKTSSLTSICKKPINWNAPELNSDIFPMFKNFFKKEGFRTVSEKQLVAELSKRAKHLCEDLEGILDINEDEAENETERKTIISLKHLWDIAAKSHDKSLADNHTFAGFVAQILAFGLLYAHRYVNEKDITPADKYQKLQIFWNSPSFKTQALRLQPFKTLVNALADELNSPFSKIGIWYDNTRRMLSCIRLSEHQITTPNFHELYESFLAAYDGKTRKDFGAWYTPMPLAQYAAKFVDATLPSVLPGENVRDKAIKVVDPCCGTGTFIEAVLNKMTLPEGSKIIGFEILPVPYALANYRISMLGVTDNTDIVVVLTNTLSDSTFKQTHIEGGASDVVSTFFLNEQRRAKKLSEPPLTIIIGNPPCSDSVDINNEGKIIAKLMNDFRPKVRKGRSNKQKQLANEMTKFLRWCLFKAEKSRPSIFALVLPSTFVQNESFVNARKYLVEHVSEMWVLDFDVDNRAGHNAENLFNTLQGRLLLVGTLRELDLSIPHIHYKCVYSLSKREKIEFFNADVDLADWEEVNIGKKYLFKPTLDVNEELYSKFWHLKSEYEPAIFDRDCSGLKLAPTHLLVHFSKGTLKRRSRFIADENNTYEQIKDCWYKGQMKPPAQKKLTHEVKKALANSDMRIVDYSFRPFLTASLILDNPLMDALRNTPGGGMRERPEVQAAYSEEGVFGFAVAPAPADISPVIKKFSSFCWYIPDNDLATPGNAHIFCNRFPEYKAGGKEWEGKAVTNINMNLLQRLVAIFGESVSQLTDEIVYYSYASLNSNFYMKAFEGKLHTVAGEWASIPITSDKSLFESMVKVGKNMANIEHKEYKANKSTLATVLGNVASNNYQEFKLSDYQISDGKIILLDEHESAIVTVDVSDTILRFEASGYNIIEQWLKYHSYAYYRKVCSNEDIHDLFNLIGRIAEYQTEAAISDGIMKQILKGDLIKPIK